VVYSSVDINGCQPGERYWRCRYWLDAQADFEEVRITGRRGNRLALEILTGPEAGQATSAFANSLWPADEMDMARQGRARDLAIRAIDLERPLDTTTVAAIELCCLLATGDVAYDGLEEVRALLRRLGRSDGLQELHRLAYAESDSQWARVCAPKEAWRGLFQALAEVEPQLVDERGAEVAADLYGVTDFTREAALAMVRGWASLPAGQEMDEVTRLRALVELAAEALDDASRPDQALRIRQAAFPERFSREGDPPPAS
jgi:hypothetical protein